MVGTGRFELPTSPTRKERSTRLSHAPTRQILPSRPEFPPERQPSNRQCVIRVRNALQLQIPRSSADRCLAHVTASMRVMLTGLIGAALTGLLLVIALPPINIDLAAWIALVPVLLCIRKRGFLFGFLFGLLSLIAAIAIALSGALYKKQMPDGDISWTVVGFCLFGVLVGFVCAIYADQKRLTPLGTYTISAAAILLEALLMFFLPAHLGLTQYRIPAAMWLASFAGIWAVSFLTWLANLALTEAIVAKNTRTTAIIAGLVSIFTLTRLVPKQSSGDFTVAAIQTPNSALSVLAEMNAQTAISGAQLCVWPELSAQSAAPRGNTPELAALLKSKQQCDFVTTFEDSAEPLPHNSAALISTNGISDLYHKRKLFGGEYTVHARGTEPMSATSASATIGLNICFDSCFPHIIRETARLPNVELIALPTLDPATPHGVIQSIHAAYTPFRSAENGIAIIRADITAHSMIVDRDGTILREAGTGTEEAIIANIHKGGRWTFYQMAGDWFVWACALWAAYRSLMILKSRKRKDSA